MRQRIRIDTSDWQRSNAGRNPTNRSGAGLWLFCIGTDGIPSVFTFNGLYREALRAAVGEARRLRADEIRVKA